MNDLKTIDNPQKNSKIPKLRLQCYFKKGPKEQWKYNGDWLIDYYKKKYNLNMKNQRSAVLFKIKQIKDQCKRIIVYDNREEAEVIVWLEIIDSKVMVNNTGYTTKALLKEYI